MLHRYSLAMQQTLPWILASLAIALLAGAAGLWALSRRKPETKPLPTEWTLTARPVFSTDERRVYRQLREALRQRATVGEVSDALRDVWGIYTPTDVF